MHGPVAVMHVAAASVALLAGLIVVWWPKGSAAHRLAGLTYVFAMVTANLSALMIYHLTGHFDLFHAFALLSLTFILGGLVFAVLRSRGWLARHVTCMAWSYLGLLAAASNEAVIRLPLHVDTPARIIAAGIVIAIATGIAGTALRPRWEQAVLDFGRR